MDCSLPGFSVHGVLQARILEWVAISFSRGSSRPRDWTQVSCIAGRVFTHWGTREAVELEFALMPLSCSRSPLLPFRTFRIQFENTSCHPPLPLRLIPILRLQYTDHLRTWESWALTQITFILSHWSQLHYRYFSDFHFLPTVYGPRISLSLHESMTAKMGESERKNQLYYFYNKLVALSLPGYQCCWSFGL